MNYKSSNIGGRKRLFKPRFLAPLKTENKLATIVAPIHKFPQKTYSNQSNQRNFSKNFSVRRKATAPIPPPGDNIRIIPLGGVEEIGKNMTVVEYKGDIIVVDCGMQFSNENTPGVDYILPNTAYLEERKDKIRAVVITHGHLDHIGGIPYLINRLGNPPIWCREFGALLIQKRQLEHPHLPALNLKIVGADDGVLSISPNLKLRFFGLTHSIPDSAGVIIETPEGDLVFTGDVRVENKNGVPAEKELTQYKIFKDRNVLFLAMDSTGVDRAGWAISENAVIETVDKIVAEAPGRVLIATFSSQVQRIIGFIEIARKYGRKVAIDGRSMKTNLEIIKQLRLSEIKHAISIEESNNYPPHKVLVLATGAQGEEFASLMRMATGTHKQIKLQRTDTIILSSSVIPGNEHAVITLKDNLYRHDAKVITYLDSDVHASGHGKRGELEWIHQQIKYKFFMPMHGYHFMLKIHAELARTLGAPRENVVVPDDGSIIEIEKGGKVIKKLREKAPANSIMVDGFSVGDVQEVVIRDRQLLAEDGMFVIIASVNSATGHLKKSPDIISRGFVYLRESQALLQETRLVVKRTVEEAAAGMRPINFEYIKTILTENVSRFLYQKTAKRPIVIPVVLGV
ncbi:MAG: ribonuclease J [Parcubacteria group bacterium Gr01-1014_73]|nr:MAG: ribonuclease J [Parcubacteria group bacterium Gr01-1014_73]